MTAAVPDRASLERVLGHPVDVVLDPAPGSRCVVAISRTGDPERVRAAWVTPELDVTARLGCPPGVPSAVRPLIATLCDVSAEGASDHLLLGRVAGGITRARAVLAAPEGMSLDVHPNGILTGRIPRDAIVVALDALSADGEPIGRLLRTGINDMTLVAGRIEGRMGSGHGMAAGFGAGDTVRDLGVAEAEAGYQALLPQWLPAGFRMTTVRVEPEAAYPFAPPSIAVAWMPPDSDARVLLRQCPGPLAVPETPDARGVEVDIDGTPGVLRARGMAFLVWERGDRAFGLQVRGSLDPSADAIRVAASIPATRADMP